MRIKTILAPQEVAEICFLSEAVMWAAFNRFPLASTTTDGWDGRREFEWMEGLDPKLDEDIPDDAESAFAGLPSRPTYEERLPWNQHRPPEHIRRSLAAELHDEYRENFQHELEASIEFHAAMSVWDEEMKGLLDIHQSRLFMALREGKLEAEGIKLPEKTCEASLVVLDQTKWEGWNKRQWVGIPPDFWRSDRINWRKSWAEGREAAYALIQVKTEALFDRFPPPQPSGSAALRVGHNWMLPATEDDAHLPRKSRGRPSLDWDSFHVEVAARIRASPLPEKQEAFIAEMQEWCSKEWRQQVARSTLLQKIKPYYDRFVRNSDR
jgi:hypothetical protein